MNLIIGLYQRISVESEGNNLRGIDCWVEGKIRQGFFSPKVLKIVSEKLASNDLFTLNICKLRVL